MSIIIKSSGINCLILTQTFSYLLRRDILSGQAETLHLSISLTTEAANCFNNTYIYNFKFVIYLTVLMIQNDYVRRNIINTLKIINIRNYQPKLPFQELAYCFWYFIIYRKTQCQHLPHLRAITEYFLQFFVIVDCTKSCMKKVFCFYLYLYGKSEKKTATSTTLMCWSLKTRLIKKMGTWLYREFNHS